MQYQISYSICFLYYFLSCHFKSSWKSENEMYTNVDSRKNIHIKFHFRLKLMANSKYLFKLCTFIWLNAFCVRLCIWHKQNSKVNLITDEFPIFVEWNGKSIIASQLSEQNNAFFFVVRTALVKVQTNDTWKLLSLMSVSSEA